MPYVKPVNVSFGEYRIGGGKLHRGFRAKWPVSECSVVFERAETLVHRSASKAVVGGIAFGPLGALIGGRKRTSEQYLLVIQVPDADPDIIEVGATKVMGAQKFARGFDEAVRQAG